MQDILSKIFDEYRFEIMDVSWGDFSTVTYTNDKSETYIIVYVNGIPDSLYEDIMDLCTNKIFMSKKLTKAQKSNLYIVVTSKIEEALGDTQYNHIYKIEENNLYYKKYFFWYTDEEVDNLRKLLGENISSEQLNEKLVDYDSFLRFKESDLGYTLLSRLYIKFAFLTLVKIKTLNKTLTEYIEESVNELNPQLYEKMMENFDNNKSIDIEIDTEIELINLTEKELNDIEKIIEEVK